MLKGKNIILGICGGIAAYKSCELTSRLKKLGAKVDVIMTASASQFITPLTLEVLSESKVTVDMFDRNHSWEVEHIALAKKADLFIVAPATANIIGKLAGGIADDMLSTTIMATKAPVLIVPAMNTNMLLNDIVQENINKLKTHGYIVSDTAEGMLACKDVGLGKMIEPEEIISLATDILDDRVKDFKGKIIVVTAGPTMEPLDPVRFITNHSTGKMGFAIAEAGARRGAKVYLITGRTGLAAGANIERIDVTSAESMKEAIDKVFDKADIIIKSAAVADYAPADVSDEKIKKNGEDLILKLKKTPDILYELGQKKGNKILVGFAMETQNLIENATKKVKKKNLDFIVANNLKTEGAGFGVDTNVVKIIDKNGGIEELPLMSKEELANEILDRVLDVRRT